MQKTLRHAWLFAATAWLLMNPHGSFGQESPSAPDFTRDIRPLLSDKCFRCHGPDAEHREAELRLDVEVAAKEAAIVAGDIESELVLRIQSEDPDAIMPPPASGKTLTAAEVKLLTQWVRQGAPWSKHWAYVPPRRHQAPQVTDASWPEHWIDQFIAARLQQEGLTPNQDAAPVTLIRRLHFDLIGLPPTPAQVAAVGELNQQSLETLVDGLLESPHFGERLAMYWLDLVRYADTVGYHGDQDQNISPYRDYVIDAFNRNLPFDQFTREQLAGDLLENPTVDQRVATGYNRMLQTSHEGGVQPKEYLSIYQADRVRNLSSVWLGGTLGCAQCHDHKYDPYTAHDFYAMASFFADIDESQHFKKGTNSLPTARPPELDVLTRRERMRLEDLERRIKQQQQTPGSDQSTALQVLQKQAKRLQRQRRRTMITVALDAPRTVRLLPRGNWLDESGPAMQPAVPQFLGTLTKSAERATRLDLAHWLTDPEQGVGLLTARVMANRLWYLCFGVGLSPSLDDFGGQGKPPNHPELLDRLAWELIDSDWNIKQLLRTIVLSRTYRQASVVSKTVRERDPENYLFARQSSFRLPAETIRDTALLTSGLLVDAFGGPSVKPYQPVGYYRHLNFPQRRYSHDADQRQWRRGVYVHWQRQFLHPMLKAFDAPTREECTAIRPRSNTPLAALVLLNDPTFVEAARSLAARMLEAADDDSSCLHEGFQWVLSRGPSDFERATLLQLLATSRAEFDKHAAEQLLSVGEQPPVTTRLSDHAAWTTVARAILNLSEATTRQ